MRGQLTAIGWYGLSLLPLVNALAFPTPAATSTIDATIPKTTPEPTQGIALVHGLFARDAEPSYLPASECGFFSNSSSINFCQDNWDCLFHVPNKEYGGMRGCCPRTSSESCIGFASTCYGKHEVSATPSLLSKTTDPYVTFCTFKSYPYCGPYTWPEIGAVSFDCGNLDDGTTTVYTASTETDDDDDYTLIHAVSVMYIDDDTLKSIASVNQPTSVSATTTPASKSTSTPVSSSDASDSDSGSSTPTGAIVGGVVGGVVGAVGLIAAGIFFWLLQKRKRADKSPPAYEPAVEQGPAGTGWNSPGKNEIPELDPAGVAPATYELQSKPVYAELPATPTRPELP
ncbi:hypothetical protein P170DRAFT_479494 [Aspergillus steynii IBT 23096]|uniref:Mid2 domain-containing protein n=1 Tax=Aspergillus steynii IBT 23096 TaxID=1392250 RepID=A0A2I2FWG1_9EURO|nr:uncharacterized protein P170DRAFT_479494 [Aspergillus steynii IBT 23096]PLB44955.1 hypothetical protein P170DRAFT_479494 [Aspergillus steynii IBT 23096]